MRQKQFSMDLAKLVIAAAWADGEVQHEELNTLKHLVLKIPDVSGEDWRELEIYLDHPVTDEELEDLLRNVLAGVRSNEDKSLVVSALRTLVEADGVVTPEEAEMLRRVEDAMEAKSTGLVGALSGLVGRAVRALSGEQHRTVREDRLEDFVANPVFFRVGGIMGGRDEAFSVPDDTVRKACLAAGMMAVVAYVDGDVAKAEEGVIRGELASTWGLSEADVEIIASAAIDLAGQRLDVFRLGQSLQHGADLQQRRALLEALFKVARASEGLSSDELAKLRRISNSLGLSRDDLRVAKERA